ncbi:MAG: methylmalonyl-CoA mutase family protein, partial [Dehalococcoidia bacterium]|nr:methylmalonyl-CoA mutase family protein [Dehalococcoidia bacterium]
SGYDYAKNSGHPGSYPFTRGVHTDMYRGRLWTRRNQCGFGTPRDTNERIKYLFSQGQTGLSVSFDLPTHHGFDPDHPLAQAEAGRIGASVVNLQDIDEMLAGIPIDQVSLTLVTRPPASAVIVALLMSLARKRGVDPASIQGTIMNDPFAQVAGATIDTLTHFLPLEPTVELAVDVIEHCAQHMPLFNSIGINAYNMRETGISAVQEAAFGLAAAIEIVERTLKRGLKIDQFAPRISFYCSAGMDFFEEIAKFRALRRMWARIVREEFGAQNPRSWWFRFACQTAGLSLQAPQPLNNIVRTSIENLAAVLGGAQSVHTNAYDEPLSLPSESSVRTALRTQQIVAYETGAGRTTDPLGGSYFVENLTDRVEEAALKTLSDIRSRGGFLACLQSRWLESQILEARTELLRGIDTAERVLVGVNAFTEGADSTPQVFRVADDACQARVDAVRRFKVERGTADSQAALERLQATVGPGQNLMPAIIEAVQASATLGEIADSLRQAWGFRMDT